jgi:phytoene dehydrogenase-like protein
MNSDIVIIGAGFGGLSTAIMMARLGRKVTLVEGAAQPGGCLRSYTREGVDCPVGVHYFGSAAPGELLGDFIDLLGVRSALKLRRLGQSGVIDRFILDDEVFDFPDTAEKLESTLSKRFKDSPEAVAFVMSVCRSAMTRLTTATANTTPPALPITRTALDVLTEKRLPDRMVDFLAMQGFLLGLNLSVCPAAFLLMATGSLLMSAWELGCTGSEMAHALTQAAVDAGVKLVVGDGVVAIDVDNQRARGVRLESGSRLEADAVVAAIHPKSMVELLPPEALPEHYRVGIGKLEETAGTLCAVALLDEKFHPAQDFNVYRVRGTPRLGLDGVYGQVRASGLPGTTRLVALAESPYQDWAPWHHTRTGRRGLDYRAEKMRRAERLLTDLASAIGPLHEPRIVDVWTPLTLRDWVTAPQGGTYGAQHSIRDGLDYLVLSRPPLERLFMVGQNAVAPGLLGVAMGVIRVAGALAGRQAVGELLARSGQSVGSAT